MKRLFTIDEKYHGKGKVQFAWQREGNFLATAGQNGLVHIFDRHGEQIDEIALKSVGPVKLDWDYEGENLAVLQHGSDSVPIWNLSARKVTTVDTGFKDPTWLKWSSVGPQLAIGTAIGNLLIYCLDTRKKIPVIGKHTKQIVCGSWNKANVLALGSEDCTLTLSKPTGETIEHTNLKAVPACLQFSAEPPKMKEDNESKTQHNRDSILSINLERKTILLYDTNGVLDPVELKFQKRYGQIKEYTWFGNGYMIVGFSHGHVVIISTHNKEMNQELYSWRLFDDSLRDLAYCSKLQKVAAIGDDSLKIIENVGLGYWRQVKGETVQFDRATEGQVASVAWTPDGQILTVGTTLGRVYNFVATMPIVHDSYGTRMVYLSSLQEVSIVSSASHDQAQVWAIAVEVEPAFVALGASHVAVGMNNRIWYYNCIQGNCQLNNEREYLGTVEEVQLGHDCAAVLCDNRIHLHPIERNRQRDKMDDSEDSKPMMAVFPDDSNDGARCMALTAELFIYGTAGGNLKYFSLRDWASLSGCDIRHTCGITRVFPNEHGTRVIFVDDQGNGFMHSAPESTIVAIPQINVDVTNVLWDWRDWGVFLVTTATEMTPFILESLNINGPQIHPVHRMMVASSGETSLEPASTECPDGFAPVLVHNGIVVGQMKNGSVHRVVLQTHSELQVGQQRLNSMLGNSTASGLEDNHSNHATKTVAAGDSRGQSTQVQYFCQNLVLGRFTEAWNAAVALRRRQYWLALSTRAMELVNVQVAIRAYRELGDAGMVMALSKLEGVEDKNLLAGHICVLFSDFSQGQELFLRSSNAKAALEMRRDLLQWDHAIKLAKTLAPEEVPVISIKFAQQLEFRGEYSAAQSMYQDAAAAEEALTAAQLQQCQAGIARTTLRLGDIRHGRKLALDSGDPQLCRECAAILEGMKQLPEAALLYEQGENYEKAASIYIATKKFAQAAPLMQRIRTTKLHAQYAKAKKAQKDYVAAAEAYERAQDMDAVVELYLDHLGQPEKACQIVRRTHSARAATMVAKHCSTHGDYASAIEFMLMAKRQTEAFELAQAQGEMGVYVEKLGSNGKPERYIQIARHYEQQQDWGKAGHFYSVCGQYHKALKFFLMCGECEMDKAIALVGEAHSDMLTHTLIDFLMGETDGVPKDPDYVFRLYMALGNYPQAAKTAIIISRQEQELGNYRKAHSILDQTQRELRQMGMRVPKNLRQTFLLLHSYLIVRGMAKSGNHLNAAHMLVRVANSISKFPEHTVEILTSCVIECQRAGLKHRAFKYASKLMAPELRTKIQPKFKRKIEQIIRKFRKAKPVEIESTPSPYAPDHKVPITDLVCPVTKNDLPWCVVTGYHMTLNDWCQCPNSKLPALHSKYKEYIAKAEAKGSAAKDPVTRKPVKVEDLVLNDPAPYLKAFNATLDEEDEEDEEEGDEGGRDNSAVASWQDDS